MQTLRKGTVYELLPNDSHKSFYGKAKVFDCELYATLYSYGTAIMTIYKESVWSQKCVVRHWNGWTKTTARHIAAFASVNKGEYYALMEGAVPVDAPETIPYFV